MERPTPGIFIFISAIPGAALQMGAVFPVPARFALPHGGQPVVSGQIQLFQSSVRFQRNICYPGEADDGFDGGRIPGSQAGNFQDIPPRVEHALSDLGLGSMDAITYIKAWGKHTESPTHAICQ